MTVRSKLALGLAAGALVIGSVSPAAARGYDGRWRHYHHDDGPSAGAIFGVLLGVGAMMPMAACLFAWLASLNLWPWLAPVATRTRGMAIGGGLVAVGLVLALSLRWMP